MRRLAVLLACALVLAARAGAADEATIALNFQEVELPVLARLVSEVTGRNLIVDERVRGKVTIISPTRITPDEAWAVFQSVLQVKGFTTVPAGSFVKIVPVRDARESAVPTGRHPGEGVVTRILPVRHAEAPALVAALQPLVSKDGLLTAYPPANALIVVDAAANVERLAGLLAELDREAPAGSARVHVYRLRYAQADAMVRVLGRLIGAPAEPAAPPRPRGSSFMRRVAARAEPGLGYDGSLGEPPPPPATAEATPGGEAAGAVPLAAPVRLTADPATNALVVSATPEDWQRLREVIDQLDVRRRQVFVEAIVLEATVDKTRTLGIEFQAAGQTSAGSSGHVGLAQANLGSLAGALTDPTSLPGLVLAAASNKLVTLPNGEQVPAHALLLTALETDTDVNVLSAPTIVTTDNEEAEIVVGRNVPFVASRATSGSNLANLFTTIERHDVGITLRLQPQITADDFVHLTIFEEVSDIDPVATAAVGDPTLVGPTTTIRSASTAVAARDGQTVVLGGLLADTRRETERRVPYLGRIPGLGHLFRREDDRRAKTNLLVFLTPHIIATDADVAETARREGKRMRSALPRDLRDRPARSR